MKNHLSISIAFVFALCFAGNARAQLVTRIYPNTINIRGICLADYSHSIAVGDSATIFISRDTGQVRDWYPLQPPCDRSHTFYGVSYYDTTHAVIIADAGLIFTTSDAGNSWTQPASSIGLTNQTLRGITHSSDGGLTVVGDSGIILRSSDEGVTWSKIESSTSHNINAIAINATGLGFFVGAHGLIGRTTDFGVTWPTVTDTTTKQFGNTTPIAFRSVAISDVDSAVAVGDSGAIARSFDGVNWEPWSLGIYVGPDSVLHEWWVSVLNRTSLLTVAYVGDPRTTMWSLAGDGNLHLSLDTGKDRENIFFGPLIYIGDADGSSDTGAINYNCQSIWRGMPHLVMQFGGPYNAISTCNDTAIVSGGYIEPDKIGLGNYLFASILPDGYGFATSDGGGFGRTMDNGYTWRNKSLFFYNASYKATDIFTIDSNNAFAVGWDASIFRTTDGGVTWDSAGISAGQQERLHSIANPADGVFLVSGDEGTILRSTDHAATWTDMNLNNVGVYPYLEAVAFSSSEIGIAAGENGSIFRTTDQGVTWNNVNNQLTGSNDTAFRQLAAFPNGTYYAATDSAGLWRSTDEGLNWLKVPNVNNTISMGFYNDSIGVVAESAWSSTIVDDTMQLAFTRDGFATAPTRFNIPIISNNRMVFHFLDSNSFLCFGSSGFVVKVDMSQGGASVTDLSAPQTSPIQVFPNPSATHATTIEYDLDHSGTTTIELWNVLGEKVQMLFAGSEIAGHHSQQLKINPELHGSFFVKVRSGTEMNTLPITIE